MAYIEPKTNWIASNIPVASDLNRIEGNTKQNHDDIAAEAIARAADVDASVSAEEAARISAVNAEEAARIAADNTKYVVGGIGAMAFLEYNGPQSSIDPGENVSASNLTWGNSSIIPSGTWQCMGWLAGSGGSTLFIRIS